LLTLNEGSNFIYILTLFQLYFRPYDKADKLNAFKEFQDQIEIGLELCSFVDQVNPALRSLLTNVFATSLLEASFALYLSSSLIFFHDQVQLNVEWLFFLIGNKVTNYNYL
jgi:hypothetical protein